MELFTKRNLAVLVSILVVVTVVVSVSVVLTQSSDDTENGFFGSETLSIKQGDLEGITVKDLGNAAEFYNIPYAHPPVEDKRWAPPDYENPPTWSGVRNAKTRGPMCLQFASTEASISDVASFSEDCLRLNVATPSTKFDPNNLAPVLIFIHGGGFMTGSGMDWNREPIFLAHEQNIVIVTLNYRLGALGFAGVETEFLGRITNGNFGLMDQFAALTWVRENIHVFGGDKEKITLSGESAGAESSLAQLLWKESREANKFKGAVLLSETWGLPLYRKDSAEKFLERLASKNGCSNNRKTDLACLKKVDAQTITDTVVIPIDGSHYPEDTRELTHLFQLWAPVIDGFIVQEQPFDDVVKNRDILPPILAGTTPDEGVALVKTGYNEPIEKQIIYKLLVKAIFGEYSDDIIDKYQCKRPCHDARVPVMDICTDYIFGCAGRIALNSTQNFVYSFEKNSMIQRPVDIFPAYDGCHENWACHGDTTQSMFGLNVLMAYYDKLTDGDVTENCFSKNPAYTRRFENITIDPIDAQTSADFRGFVGNFVKNQNPGEQWPAFLSENGGLNYMRFLKDGGWTLDGDILKETCEIWDEIDDYGHF